MRAFKIVILGLLAAALLAFTQTDTTANRAKNGADAARSQGAARCVLITGANRGLGLEFAKQYAEAGWTVIGTARKPEEAKELRATGATVLALDVTSDADVARLVKDLGGRAIDLLINNAGISSRTTTLDDIDIENMKRVLDVNLVGPMRTTVALLPNLRAGNGKTIVSISSGLGSIEGNRDGHYFGYRESKAGLNMFMRSVAAELRPEGFTCIAMSPGWVRTDMGGPSATLAPEESITAMRSVIAGLTPEKSGQFLRHTGETIPW
jgi:NAD(P)-dependent dehydrogenase (short-subunit alcohol dehydrogenase family)